MTTGFFEIGICNNKTPANLGTLWRSAYQLGASGIFTIGRRYLRQPSDTVAASRNIPLREYSSFDELETTRPKGTRIVAVEIGGRELHTFTHPKQAIYLLGAEDYGLPSKILDRCEDIINIESLRTQSYNVAIAGSLVMYHRLLTMRLQ